jgi:molybdenum cofactor biosynthesis protein MoaC
VSSMNPSPTRRTRPASAHPLYWSKDIDSASFRQFGHRSITTSSSALSDPKVLQLTHMDPVTGRPAMVNVSSKEPTLRIAIARGRIFLPPSAFELVTGASSSSQHPADASSELVKAKAKARAKGDVLAVAQLAGIMASKRTADLIPLCHPLALSHVSVTLTPSSGESTGSAAPRHSILCEATVSCEGKTGVEMEALSAVSVALLTVWDMLKAVAGKEMMIADIHVSQKSGGKSGDFERSDVGCLS